jgi:acylphosphatase
MDRIARHLFVAGIVQGVGFRSRTRWFARKVGVAGWVQNRPEGDVEVWVEGSPESVAAMLVWLRRGPPGTIVHGVEVEEVDPGALESFEIRR